MFGVRYTASCEGCKTEYKFKSGSSTRAFYKACKSKCPRCGENLELWLPLMRTYMTPPPELKLYSQEVNTIKMW